MVKARFWMSLVTVLGVVASLFVSGCDTIKGDWQKASQFNTVEAYQEFLRKYPESEFTDEAKIREKIRKGDAYLGSKDYRNAIAEYTNAIEHKPEDAILYLKRGNAYLALNQFKQAVPDYENAIVINPGLPEPYYGLGLIHFKRQEYREAILRFSKTIQLSPDHLTTDMGSVVVTHTNPLKGLAYAYRGDVHLSLGQYRQAISDYTSALKIDPKDSEKYNRRGITYAHLGEYERAISDYSMAIVLNPDESSAYKNRGVVYIVLEKTEEAKRDLLKAAELNSNLKGEIRKLSDKFGLNLKLD